MAVRRVFHIPVAERYCFIFAMTILSCSGAGAADSLSCDQFKTRLDQALLTIGADSRKPLTYGARGETIGTLGKSFAWTGDAGLSGRLTCTPDDAFADFYMTYGMVGGEIKALDRFKDLGAATVCALSTAAASACSSLIATITDDGIDQYKEDVDSGKSRPLGLQNYDITESAEAVFMITPQGASWAIGPGVFSTTTAERPKLDPHDHDEDEDD